MAERHADLPRHVRLAADYLSDPRIMRVGLTAECVFVRVLAITRARHTDGHLAAEWLRDVDRAIGQRGLRRAMDELVGEGLLEPCADGWQVPPARWFKWQDLEEELASNREKERRRKAEWRARKRAEAAE